MGEGIVLPLAAGSEWQKDPVANSASLPTTGNSDGDVRETLDTNKLYCWNATSSTWVPASGGNSFATIQPITGTSPTAASATDTLTLASDGSVGIAGNSSTDTVTFSVAQGVKSAFRPPVAAVDGASSSLPTGSSYSTDGHTAVNGERFLFTNFDNKVYVISGVGSSISWTLATDGKAGNGSPTAGDLIPVIGGSRNGYTIQRYFAGSGWVDWKAVNTLYGAGSLNLYDQVTGGINILTLDSGTAYLKGNWIWRNDNTYDIGQAGNRPASIHLGTGIRIVEGSNKRMGVATLVAGTVTVANTSITASTRIFLTVQTAGGTQGFLSTTRSAGTSFTINSSSASETSTVAWLLVEPD